MINTEDFQYMWQGQSIRPLSKTEAERLAPIDKRKPGHDRALLFLHGFSSSPAVYRAIWPELNHYHALVCPALPGHAENLAAFASVTYPEWIHAAEMACEQLIEKFEIVEVVGLSLGGLLACHLGRKYPVKHLYLLAPALKLRFNLTLLKYLTHFLHALGIKYIKNHAGNLYTHEHEELAYKKLPLRTLIELFMFIEHEKKHFTVPECPIDLFLGAHDDVVDSTYVFKQFENSDHCRIHWLQHSAHAIPLDGDIKTIIEILEHGAPITG